MIEVLKSMMTKKVDCQPWIWLIFWNPQEVIPRVEYNDALRERFYPSRDIDKKRKREEKLKRRRR